MLRTVLLLAAVVQLSAAAAIRCEPSRKPFSLPDAEFCDKFILCENTTATEMFCPDGLVFDVLKEKCDFPHVVDCGKRTKLQEAKGTLNCPRMNGMFPVDGTCNQFYHCTDGLHTLIRCPEGVIFEPKVGACVHPDLASRPNCSASTFLDFQCPNVGSRFRPMKFGDHDRLPHPKDCRFFYMCLLTGMPRLGGCSLGLVFNPKSGRCDRPKNVPGCEDYYGDMGDEEEDDQPEVRKGPAPLIPEVRKAPATIAEVRKAPATLPEIVEEEAPKAVFPEFRKTERLNRKRPSASS